MSTRAFSVALAAEKVRWRRCCVNVDTTLAQAGMFQTLPFDALRDPAGTATVAELKTALRRAHNLDPTDRTVGVIVSNAFVLLLDDTLLLRDAWPDGTLEPTVYYALTNFAQPVRPQMVQASAARRHSSLVPVCDLVPGPSILFACIAAIKQQLDLYTPDKNKKLPSTTAFLDQLLNATRCPALVSAFVLYLHDSKSTLAVTVAAFLSQGLTAMCVSLLAPWRIATAEALCYSRECFAFLLRTAREPAAGSPLPFTLQTLTLCKEYYEEARAPHRQVDFVGCTVASQPHETHVYDLSVLQWNLANNANVVSLPPAHWTSLLPTLRPDPLLRVLFKVRTGLEEHGSDLTVTLAMPNTSQVGGGGTTPPTSTAADYASCYPGEMPVIDDLTVCTRLVDASDFLSGSLRILNPRSLRSQRTAVMTVLGNGTLRVWQSLSKEPSKVNVMDPLAPAGGDTSIDFDQESETLAVWLTGNAASFLARVLVGRANGKDAPTVEDSRPVAEAVVLLMDCSGSMTSASTFPDMTRMVLAQQVAASFLDRLASYNLPHRVQLTAFSTESTELASFTSIFSRVEEKVRTLAANGGTALFDAVSKASALLIATFPSVSVAKRIFVLSDGEDQHSKCTPLGALAAMMSARVVIDAVCIGEASQAGFGKLKGLCLASGGLCLRAASTEELFHYFEAETILALSCRPPITPVPSVDATLFAALAQRPFSAVPKKPLPARWTTAVMTPTEALIKASRMRKPESANAAAVTAVMRALKAYDHNPHPFFRVYPSNDSVFFWLFTLEGPDQTPYAGGTFVGCIEFTNDYPATPPVMRMVTPMYHCNVNDDGKICHSILDRNWERATPLRRVFDCIYGLLQVPEPDDPLDTTKASLFHSDPRAYAAKATLHTKQFARGKLKDVLRDIAPISDAAEEQLRCPFPPRLTDPLTQRLFVDPVCTPEGRRYSRAPLLDWLKTNSGDPKTRTPLRADQLTADPAMAAEVAEYQRSAVAAASDDSWFN